jgi:hypothetical protein
MIPSSIFVLMVRLAGIVITEFSDQFLRAVSSHYPPSMGNWVSYFSNLLVYPPSISISKQQVPTLILVWESS